MLPTSFFPSNPLPSPEVGEPYFDWHHPLPRTTPPLLPLHVLTISEGERTYFEHEQDSLCFAGSVGGSDENEEERLGGVCNQRGEEFDTVCRACFDLELAVDYVRALEVGEVKESVVNGGIVRVLHDPAPLYRDQCAGFMAKEKKGKEDGIGSAVCRDCWEVELPVDLTYFHQVGQLLSTTPTDRKLHHVQGPCFQQRRHAREAGMGLVVEVEEEDLIGFGDEEGEVTPVAGTPGGSLGSSGWEMVCEDE